VVELYQWSAYSRTVGILARDREWRQRPALAKVDSAARRNTWRVLTDSGLDDGRAADLAAPMVLGAIG
jgi:hypothetical protein